MKVIPTCIVADPSSTSKDSQTLEPKDDSGDDEDDNKVWEDMANAESDSDEASSHKKPRTKVIVK